MRGSGTSEREQLKFPPCWLFGKLPTEAILFNLRWEISLGFSKVKRGAWWDVMCGVPMSVARSCLRPGEGKGQSSTRVSSQMGTSDSIVRAGRSKGF